MRLVNWACGFAVTILPAVGRATPINLLSNGSFEAGAGSAGNAGSFTGWTVGGTGTGSGPGLGPQRVQYGPNTTAYGDNVSADPFLLSPDPSGQHAAFFVDDAAQETLSQAISIAAGTTYEVGFDFFETNSGARNANPFTLTASLNGTVLSTVNSASSYAAGQWYHIYDVFTPTVAGTSGFTFGYASGSGFAKDVIVDDVYVETAPAADVPEPVSFALLGIGIAALAYLGIRVRQHSA